MEAMVAEVVEVKGLLFDRGAAVWRKSSASGPFSDNCVELASVPAVTAGRASGVAVRDSTNPTGPVLLFNAAEWAAFGDGWAAGEFDDL